MSATPDLDHPTDGSARRPAARAAGAPRAAPPHAAPAPPDHADALPCPLCEYDLRGLPEPRCPECGYRFTPGELDDPARRFHPYLFEHHPGRKVRSFLRTLVGGLTPRTFWSTLHPTQPSRTGRLLVYWIVCATPLLVLFLLHAWFLTAGTLAVLQTWRMRAGALARSDVRFIARHVANFEVVDGGGYGLVTLFCLTWPWATLASLLLFQISLRRARLRWTHVLRCVLYSGDLCLWLVVPIGFLAGTAWLASGWPPRPFFPNLTALLPWAALALVSYRLHSAYRLYLRFDHALATVAASQAIVLLVYWKLWLMAEGY